MDYFNEAWQGGIAAGAHGIIEAYHQHLMDIAIHLSPSVQELACETNLHDGLIRRIVLEGDALQVELRCGDLRVGYFDVDLSYKQVCLGASDTAALFDLAHDENASALYDEVDLEGPGAFVHRILFGHGLSDDQEVTIHFRGLELTKTPQPSREFAQQESRFP